MSKAYIVKKIAVTNTERYGVYDNPDAAEEHARAIMEDNWNVITDGDSNEFIAVGGGGRVAVEEADLHSAFGD